MKLIVFLVITLLLLGSVTATTLVDSSGNAFFTWQEPQTNHFQEEYFFSIFPHYKVEYYMTSEN